MGSGGPGSPAPRSLSSAPAPRPRPPYSKYNTLVPGCPPLAGSSGEATRRGGAASRGRGGRVAAAQTAATLFALNRAGGGGRGGGGHCLTPVLETGSTRGGPPEEDAPPPHAPARCIPHGEAGAQVGGPRPRACQDQPGGLLPAKAGQGQRSSAKNGASPRFGCVLVRPSAHSPYILLCAYYFDYFTETPSIVGFRRLLRTRTHVEKCLKLSHYEEVKLYAKLPRNALAQAFKLSPLGTLPQAEKIGHKNLRSSLSSHKPVRNIPGPEHDACTLTTPSFPSR